MTPTRPVVRLMPLSRIWLEPRLVFPIKRRIGRGTWEEIDFCRKERKPTLIYFADASFCGADWHSVSDVQSWAETLLKRAELTADWF